MSLERAIGFSALIAFGCNPTRSETADRQAQFSDTPKIVQKQTREAIEQSIAAPAASMQLCMALEIQSNVPDFVTGRRTIAETRVTGSKTTAGAKVFAVINRSVEFPANEGSAQATCTHLRELPRNDAQPTDDNFAARLVAQFGREILARSGDFSRLVITEQNPDGTTTSFEDESSDLGSGAPHIDGNLDDATTIDTNNRKIVACWDCTWDGASKKTPSSEHNAQRQRFRKLAGAGINALAQKRFTPLTLRGGKLVPTDMDRHPKVRRTP